MIDTLWRNALYYLTVAVRHPFYIVCPFLLVMAAGISFALSMPRQYYSEGLLVMEFQQIPSSLVSPVVANDRLRFIDQRVLSRSNLVALEQRLDVFPKLADAEEATIAKVMRANITMRTTISELADGSATGASVVIGFKHEQAGKAVGVASELIRMIIDENRRLRQARASETTQFLQKEVDDLTGRQSTREAEWARYAEDHKDAQPSRLPTMLIELQAREDELVSVQESVSAGKAEVDLLQTQLRVGIEANSVASRIGAQIRQIREEISSKQSLYTPQHPQMRILQQKLDDLKAAVAPPAPDQLTPAQPDLLANLPPEVALLLERLNQAKPRQEALTERLVLVKERIADLKQTIARTSDVEKRLTAINIDRQTLQRSLDDMKGRLATALMGERLEQKDAATHVEVLEQPALPRSPSGPRRLILFGAVGILAMGAGAAGLFAFDATDRRIRGAFDLEDALPGQTLVMVPDWTPRRGRAVAWT
jgi:uncharacterized protein involved in exopolysaccharide biosynthesis